jgi:taurine dioxygenase
MWGVGKSGTPRAICPLPGRRILELRRPARLPFSLIARSLRPGGVPVGTRNDTLSPVIKRLLDGLEAVHAAANAGGTSYAREFEGKGNVVAAQAATHPVVIVHPDSGRKTLFVNRGYTSHIVGMTRAESDAPLGFLFEHATAPELVYRHSWRKYDLVIWDNRCTVHYAIPDYIAIGDRYMHRTSIKGDRPVCS